MRSILILVVAIALTNAFNLKAFLKSEIAELEKYIESEPNQACMDDPAFTVSSVCVDPYPIKGGQTLTVVASGTGNRDVTLKSYQADVKALFIKKTVTGDIPEGVPTQIKKGPISINMSEAIPSLPIPFALTADVTAKLFDANGNQQFCGKFSAKVGDILPPEEELLPQEISALMAGPQVKKCEDKDYEVSLEKAVITPYPIQRGKEMTMAFDGVSQHDGEVKDLQVKYGVIPVRDIKYNKHFSAGVDFELTDTESIPSVVPSYLKHATLTTIMHDEKDGQLACYKVTIAFADAVEADEE